MVVAVVALMFDSRATTARAQSTSLADPIRIGVMCDRSGPTANIGNSLCDGAQDWIAVVNESFGGIGGRRVQPIEVDHRYEVPIGVDGYKKLVTRDNVPMIMGYGTPFVDALAQSANEDQVVLWSTGYGFSDMADGRRFPYVTGGVATYRAQARAALRYIQEDWQGQGRSGSPRVIFSFYDNLAGRDPLTVIRSEAASYDIDLIADVAIPATTVDMTTAMMTFQAEDPDYLLTNYFGRVPALSLQAATRLGFPRERMISLAWGLTSDEPEVVGPAAEGARGILFSAVPSDDPEAYQWIRYQQMASGRSVNPRGATTWYARGVLTAALMAEALRLSDDPSSGPAVKRGAESMRDFTAYGMAGGVSLTPEDHAGTNLVRVYQVQNGALVLVRDWFEG